MKKFAILFLLFITASAFAQPNFKKVDQWLKDNAENMGGRAMLVLYKDGKVIYSHSEKDMTPRQKIATRALARKMGQEANLDAYTLSTRVPIASCSKWLSAALVMTFVDEGKLQLTDTIGKFLPIMTQNGKGGITIDQCLSHRTGIKAADLKESLQDMKGFKTMDDAIANLATMPMEGKPGTVFRYSNAGLQIAGAVLEKISGKTFEQLFAERIAQPLNMTNTDFGHKAVPLPAGGAYSTPQDYTNFLSMILNRGMCNGRRILSEASIAQMQVNRITPGVTVAYTPANAQQMGYGYGEWVFLDAQNNPVNVVASPGLFGSFPWVDNNKGYCGFLMCVNLKHEGRQELYASLKKVVDEALGE